MCNRTAAVAAIVSVSVLLGVSGRLAAEEVVSHRCATVIEPSARLTCYDTQYPPSIQVQAAAANRQINEFGWNGQREPIVAEAGPASLKVKVTSLVYRPDGTRTVELDSDQQWLITEATSRGHLVEGDQVILRKAALGSYMLVTPAGVTLRARRIR
jgi:hypothetical protein